MANVYILDTNESSKLRLPGVLESELLSLDLRFFTNQSEFADAVSPGSCDLMIIDADFPDLELFEFLDLLRPTGIPVLVVSESDSQRLAVECLRTGAADFVSWRNVKLGYVPTLVQRMLLETRLTDEDDSTIIGELSRDIRSFIYDEELVLEKERFHRGEGPARDTTLVAGETYDAVFLYACVRTNHQAVEKNDWLLRLIDHAVSSISRIPARFDRSFEHLQDESCFFGYVDRPHLRAILSAFAIQAEVRLLNISIEKLLDQLGVSIGLAAGSMVYKEDVGRIYSEGLNLAAHMARGSGETNQLSVTADIYNNLGHMARRYFERGDEVDGVPIYSFRAL